MWLPSLSTLYHSIVEMITEMRCNYDNTRKAPPKTRSAIEAGEAGKSYSVINDLENFDTVFLTNLLCHIVMRAKASLLA